MTLIKTTEIFQTGNEFKISGLKHVATVQKWVVLAGRNLEKNI